MLARLNALLLGTLLFVSKPTAFRADNAVASSDEGQAGSCRMFIDEESNTTVMQEAFNSDGESLGCSYSPESPDSPDSGWTMATTDFNISEEENDFEYHVNASYYIVGYNDSVVVEFWHPFADEEGGKDMAAVHLKVARNMVLDNRSEGKDQLSVKVVNKGWQGVVDDEMCNQENVNSSCPALVLAGTTQMASRHDKGDTLELNQYMSQWAEEEGWILTDDFIKYYFYDFYYDGSWIAVPLVSDTRVLAYNKTTFDAYDIDKPPDPSSTPWEWSKFVEIAGELTEATGREGWYFKGSWDEELKISLMIARSWRSTLYRREEDGRRFSALGGDFIEAMNATVTKMLREKWVTRDFVPEEEVDIEELLRNSESYTDIAAADIPCCSDPEFSTNSSELWGMTIVAPGTLVDIIDEGNDEIVEALVPDRFSFLGGSGLFISKKASSQQQDLGWELLKGMIGIAQTYAMVQRSPPPLERALEDGAWLEDAGRVQVEQLRTSVPAQYPNGGFPEFGELEASKPFRLMWLDIRMGTDTAVAVAKVNELLNEILKTECTEDSHDHESCRICTEEDYDHDVSPCDPKTQHHTVRFWKHGKDGPCFAGPHKSPEYLITCDHVEVASRFGIAIITVSCLGGVMSLLAAGLVYAYRHRPVIKFSQPRFCVLFSLGVAGMCFSNLALVGKNSVASCVARTTVWGIAFDLAFGALFSKVYRVRRIVSNAPGRRVRTRRSFLPLVSVVSLAMVVDVLVLSMWSVLDDQGPIEVSTEVGEVVITQTTCASEGDTWGIVFISFKIMLIAWGCYLAWVTRKISNTLVEGREISWSIYLFAVLAIILIFIGWAGLSIQYWAVAKAFVYSLSSCTALVMVLVPKLWGAHKQQEVDVTQLMDGTTMTGTTGRGSSMSHDMDVTTQQAPGVWTIACSQCGTQINASNFIRSKGAPQPMLPSRPGAGVMRSALVGGWEVVAASQRGFSEGSENVRNKPPRPDAAARKRSSSSSGSSTAIGLGSKKDPQFVTSRTWEKATAGNEARFRLPPPPAAPSSGGSGVFRETEVGLALKLTKMERGFRRSPASSTGGTPSIGEPVGRPPSSGFSSSTRRLGLSGMPHGVGTAASRKRGGSWRGGWKRSSRDDSIFSSSSPHSELDAASFSRSLQAQAAAMRAALWSSTSQSQSQSHSQSQSESESHYKRSSNGSGRIAVNFGRKSAAVQPALVPKASPGSMRIALNAERAASAGVSYPIEAINGGTNGTTISGTAEPVDATSNPMLIAAAGLGGTGATLVGARAATAAGRPPAHRVPPLRLDSTGAGTGSSTGTGTCTGTGTGTCTGTGDRDIDNHPPVVNQYRTPPPGGAGFLQPWVSGAPRTIRRGAVRGTWGQQGPNQFQRPQLDSIATTSQVSRTSQTSIGMSSAASYSPDTGAGIIGGQYAIGTPISSPSAASDTSVVEARNAGWNDPKMDIKPGEQNMSDLVEDSDEVEDENDADEGGAAKTRKLIVTPASGSTYGRPSLPVLWGPGTEDLGYDSPSGAGAAKTRKLIHTPNSVHRYRRAEDESNVDHCFAVGVPVEVISVGGTVVPGSEGARAGAGGGGAPQSDNLDGTPVVKAQWVQQSPGHLV